MIKKKNKNKKQTSSPSFSNQKESLNNIQESINSLDRDANKQTNKIVGLLKKILNWKIIGGTAAIITAIPVVYNWISYNPVDETKQNIYSSIKTIEETFRPETIPSDKDSIYNIKAIKKFQLDVKELCAVWQDMETTPPLESLSNNLAAAKDALLEYSKHYNHYFEVSNRVRDDIYDIQLYANNVGEINYQVNINKIKEISRLESIKNNLFEEVFKDVLNELEVIQIKSLVSR